MKTIIVGVGACYMHLYSALLVHEPDIIVFSCRPEEEVQLIQLPYHRLLDDDLLVIAKTYDVSLMTYDLYRNRFNSPATTVKHIEWHARSSC